MLVWIAKIVTEMGLVEKRGFVLLAGLELRDPTVQPSAYPSPLSDDYNPRTFR